VLHCCAILGKTQYEIENEYAWIDLPELLRIRDEQRARELFELLDVSMFPHVADKRAREEIVERIKRRLPKPPSEPPKSAEEQYQALLMRMKAGG